MSELSIEQQARGTRIIFGEEAEERRMLLNKLIGLAKDFGAQEIILPAIEKAELYVGKAGEEILGQMYTFPDKKGRALCLRPEATATIQAVQRQHFETARLCVWYFERCYRYEKPQAGRYREFWQFGVEWLNPKFIVDATNSLQVLAANMIAQRTTNYRCLESVKRGLSYYTGEGFEFVCDELGAQKQVCGGGPYEGGVGFAIGFDRLMMCKP
jgi:histidyl-tRNA synthetase